MPELRCAATLALILLTGCVGLGPSAPSAPSGDGPPAVVPPHLASLPPLVPRDEPKSKYGNPATYEVFGKTYRTWPTAEGYSEVGTASWYGRKFHGRRTSSGEPFDMYALSAAHRSLPLPTYVRVTNLENGRTTVVRVNDRGPFVDGRLIDLSFATAVKLGFHNNGTARVRVETVTASRPAQIASPPRLPEPKAAPQIPAAAAVSPSLAAVEFSPKPHKRWVLQAGAFSALAGADRLARTLSKLVSAPASVVKTGDDGYYRVHLGPLASLAEARRIQALVAAQTGSTPLLID